MTPNSARPRAQRGVASLIIVSLLFFVLSLVAAYANRNLIFEQRTATNQYRSTLALEAAEAGLEWAIAMLNGGRITDTCTPSDDEDETSFRERYLAPDAVTGVITLTAAGAAVWPSCVFDGTSWECSCPTEGAPDVDAPGGDGLHPAFRVRFVAMGGTQPGVVRIESNGCTSLNDSCLNFPSAAANGEGRASVRALLALRNGLAAPPVAAVTARGTVDLDKAVGDPVFRMANGNGAAGGIALLAGGNVDVLGIEATSTAGTPSEQAIVANDTGLASLGTGERLFVSSFTVASAAYQTQPGALQLDCNGGCTADDVRDAVALNPGRVIWAAGDVDIGDAEVLGSATAPILLVSTGQVSLGAGASLFGLVYSRATDWTTSGSGTVTGAIVAEGNLGGTANWLVQYDKAVLERLHWQTGSFVRVPGGWRDF